MGLGLMFMIGNEVVLKYGVIDNIVCLYFWLDCNLVVMRVGYLD